MSSILKALKKVQEHKGGSGESAPLEKQLLGGQVEPPQRQRKTAPVLIALIVLIIAGIGSGIYFATGPDESPAKPQLASQERVGEPFASPSVATSQKAPTSASSPTAQPAAAPIPVEEETPVDPSATAENLPETSPEPAVVAQPSEPSPVVTPRPTPVAKVVEPAPSAVLPTQTARAVSTPVVQKTTTRPAPQVAPRQPVRTVAAPSQPAPKPRVVPVKPAPALPRNQAVPPVPSTPIRAVAPAPVQVTPPRLMVTGIVYQDDPTHHYALVNDRMVKEGQTVSGAVVKKIFKDHLLFRYQGQPFEIFMGHDKPLD